MIGDMVATLVTVFLVFSAGACEFLAAVIALREFRRASARVPQLRTPAEPVLEVLTTTSAGVSTLFLDRVARAVLAQWTSTRSSRIAVAFLVPFGILLGTAGGVAGALK